MELQLVGILGDDFLHEISGHCLSLFGCGLEIAAASLRAAAVESWALARCEVCAVVKSAIAQLGGERRTDALVGGLDLEPDAKKRCPQKNSTYDYALSS
jgi:hypothetical protein